MVSFIVNEAARDAVIAKLATGPNVDMAPGTKGRLKRSVALDGTNGQIAMSVDRAGVQRFYDGVLVHEQWERS